MSNNISHVSELHVYFSYYPARILLSCLLLFLLHVCLGDELPLRLVPATRIDDAAEGEYYYIPLTDPP
jgi:hypothetical protein